MKTRSETAAPPRVELVLDVSGFLELLVLRHKPYGLSPELAKIQADIAGSYHTISGPPKANEERFMDYHLSLPDLSRYDSSLPQQELARLIQTLEEEMHEASAELKFEYAARLRDEVNDLKRELRDAG